MSEILLLVIPLLPYAGPMVKMSQSSPLHKSLKRISAAALQSFSYLRTLLYLQESLPLQWLDLAINWQQHSQNENEVVIKHVLPHIQKLIREDAQNIVDGVYPVSVLYPEGPKKHAQRYKEILQDALKLSLRRRKKKFHDFSSGAKIESQGLPEYYVRNFHNQTNGYLSDQSANIYDHQVDILFRGTTGAMRRMILPPLKEFIRNRPDVNILEIGCGTGSATKDFLKTFPKTALTAIDLSRPYLKFAAHSLADYKQAQFIFANAEKLPFADGTFDATFSVYVFHELPASARGRVIAEAFRILKPDGIFLIVDSLQKGDLPEFDKALELFPKIFHEPFYKNYTETPLGELIEQQGFQLLESRPGGSSKLWVALKPKSRVH